MWYRNGVLIALVGLVLACAPPSPPAAPASQPTVAAAPQTATNSRTPAATDASNQSAAFKQVVEGARSEGQLELWITLQDATVPVLEAAFNSRFGLNVKIQSVTMPATTATSRVITESNAGQKVGDLFQPSLDLAQSAVDAKALDKTDWVGTFGAELPGVKEASDVFVPDLQGFGLHYIDITYAFGYNTTLIQKKDVPTNWDDLAMEKWRRKLSLDARGAPFYYLLVAPGWDKDRLNALVSKLTQLDPILANPSRGDEIARGEVPIQVTGTGSVDQLKAKGAPLDYVLPDTIPFNPLLATVPSQAKHPNAARLFAAWLTTEGMATIEKMEFNNRLTDPSSSLARTLKEQQPNATLAVPKTVQQMHDVSDLSKDFAAQFASVSKP
jgi:iron(III) transport system substrate-binding protein